MDELILLLVIVASAVLIMPICALVFASRARRETRELRKEVERLRDFGTTQLERLNRLSSRVSGLEDHQTTPQPKPAPQVETPVFVPPLVLKPEPAPKPVFVPQPELPKPAPKREITPPTPKTPPPLPKAPELNLEQFMGAKLFAWVGGLALFLGVVFFVKHSMEQGWISPALRMAMGLITGIGLVVSGVITHRRPRYLTLAQTLIATGIVMLYGVSFTAHAIWHIAPFDHALVTFGFMAAVTAAAFLLAVRLNAQVVAVLGLLGGFLTPILCSTGHDNPFGLWSYIALLCLGVLAVVKHTRWHHLVPLAAGGVLVMQFGWLAKFWNESQYAHGAATWVPIGVMLGFAALFTTALVWMKNDEKAQESGALMLLAGAWLTALNLLWFESITNRPGVLYTLVFGVSALVMTLVWLRPRVKMAQGINAGLGFLHLMIWTTSSLKTELLPWALGLYLLFGAVHTAFAVLWQRRGESVQGFLSWTPVISLALMMLPVLCLNEVSVALWPAVLLADALVIGVAIATGALATVLAALVLTLITVGLWLFARLPSNAALSLAPFLTVLGGFSLLFIGVGSWLAKKRPQAQFAGSLPVCAAVMPFVLLIAATLHLKVANPSPMFGLALLLTAFMLGLARVSGITQLVPAALGCVLALTWSWHAQSFDAESPVLPLLWYLGFYALFTLHPLLFRAKQAERKLPWISSAAAGLGFFGLVFRVVTLAWPNGAMGLLPLGFALPPLLLLVFVLKKHAPQNPARLTQLAWYGGVALFFITLVFPVQFERQWITLGWALEGAALCWLFRRVPHDGLRLTGAGLLIAAFVRLALNPDLWSGQVRGDTALMNWPLYALSLTALAQFAAAWQLTPPSHLWREVNLRGLFLSLGTALVFLLMSYEIADFYTSPTATVHVLRFGDSFARDMVTTIAWSLFALALLSLGIWKKAAPVRYTGIALLGVALIKLFLHDLANIGNIYRVGALMIVAVIALAASYLYQRFLQDEPKS
ncbi:MAG: DUF2339 domain-containing protein [Verrucomicrobiaceae bacterium]|nr:DUF2339 domain-containing protein [Verrucomicrobiaceae bacterium]